MDGTFITINILAEDRCPLRQHPICYYWDFNDKIEDIFSNDKFVNEIKKLNIEDFLIGKIYLTYITEDQDGEFIYKNLEFSINKLYDVCEFYGMKLIYSVLDFLYFCSFKKHYEDVEDLISIYNEIQSKYPKKITKEVVSNYIKSKLSEDYPELSSVNLDKIVNKFNDIVK